MATQLSPLDSTALVKATGPSKLVRLDRLLGLRGWGLILYGALPANLALIGVIEVKMALINQPLWLLPIVVPLPVMITYLLIRTRQTEWYLATNRLAWRTAITTLLLILLASLISGAAKLIQGKYVFEWACLFSKGHFITMGESFLFGISSLVVSSTLFMTILTKGSDLPGLPSTAFVALLSKIRQGLKQIQKNPIWQYPPISPEEVNELKEIAETLQTNLENVMAEPGHRLAKQSLNMVKDDLDCFLEQIVHISKGGTKPLMKLRWCIYFEDEARLSDTQKEDRQEKQNLYDALQRIKSLQLGG